MVLNKTPHHISLAHDVTRARAAMCRSQVELLGQIPPIEKMDASLAVLKNCK